MSDIFTKDKRRHQKLHEDIIRQLKDADKPQEHELDDIGERNITGNRRDHWGYHLMLDCSLCNEMIDDEQTIKEFIEELVEELDMKPIGKPMLARVDSEEEGRGISALQLITTSNISCHFDDKGRAAYIDVFSCKRFDPMLAINLVQKTFEPEHMGKFWIFRDTR